MREFMNRSILTAGYAPQDMNEYKKFMEEAYSYGQIDETISRIGEKLEGLCRELRSLNTMLENYHDK